MYAHTVTHIQTYTDIHTNMLHTCTNIIHACALKNIQSCTLIIFIYSTYSKGSTVFCWSPQTYGGRQQKQQHSTITSLPPTCTRRLHQARPVEMWWTRWLWICHPAISRHHGWPSGTIAVYIQWVSYYATKLKVWHMCIPWNLLMWTLENMDISIIHILSWGPKWHFNNYLSSTSPS